MVKLTWFSNKKENKTENQLEMGVESLESRRLLAGTVDVTVSGNDIVVRGDSADNQIQLVSNGGFVRVEGLAGTSVNGEFTNVPVNNVSRLTINMRGGNDYAFVRSAITTNARTVMDGGTESDQLIYYGKANSDVIMRGGADNDDILMRAVAQDVFGAATLEGGGGQDAIAIQAAPAFLFRDDITMAGGAEMDTLASDVNVLGTQTMLGQGGNDKMFVDGNFNASDFVVRGGAGNDELTVNDSVFFAGMDVIMAGGNDIVRFVNGNTINQPADIRLNGGSDFLFVDNLPAFGPNGEIDASGGAGFDTAVLPVLHPGVNTSAFEVIL